MPTRSYGCTVVELVPIVCLCRYDADHGRFTDPPPEYTTTVDSAENYKYCESCVRKAAQEQVCG